jgi:hypothetical protein
MDKVTYTGSEKTIETVVSGGSSTTLAGELVEENDVEEPVSLIQHMAMMGRRGSDNHDPNARNRMTVTKEVYIREDHVHQGQV